MRDIIYILILFPVVAFPQSHQGTPPNMNIDMEQMQKVMACMTDLDRSALEGLEQEGKKMESEVWRPVQKRKP